MEKIRVVIENTQKTVKIPTGVRLLMRRCCHAVLEMEHFEGSAQVDITLVDNQQIRKYNNEHRHIDAVTDVLSFPLGENGRYDINPENGAYMLGDIVLSVERALEQAEQFGHSLQREIGYLTVHSMLHLLGYDHTDGGLEAVRMREKEEAVMTSIGLPRGESYVMIPKEKKNPPMKRFLKSFVYAGRGVWFCLRRERNFRFHLVAAVYVLSFAPLFSLTRGEWAALLAVVGMIPALEAVNTAIERSVDLASPQRQPLAEAAKDAAAAAVLLACLAALGVAAALFVQPDVWRSILDDWRQSLWKPGLLLLSLPCAVWFIWGGGDPSQS